MKYAFFDTEIIGKNKPKFLCCVKIGKQVHSFWAHKKGHLKAMGELFARKDLTFVGFNSENFDRPLIAAAFDQWDDPDLKQLANTIIGEEMRSWQTYKQFNIPFVNYDHIDLIDVAPGVMISLKTYAGRMSYPSMLDMPIHHDTDLTPTQEKIVEEYCVNDVGVTEALFKQLSTEIELRYELSATYGIDLRSKSDAQIAEAILKNKCGIKSGDKYVPSYITYEVPKFIKTTHAGIKEIVELLEDHQFKINRNNGSPENPEFLKEPLRINNGFYQMGIGGLHSTHDQNMCLEAGEDLILSDFDVASYYPNIMMTCGLVPKLGGNKGELFIEEYRKIYKQRMEAKRRASAIKKELKIIEERLAQSETLTPLKKRSLLEIKREALNNEFIQCNKTANSLKISLNGTFGKLGNLYCSFYSPDLMLAVTVTGQLNLLCLIHELEKIKGVSVRSANTDGVLVAYPPLVREKVLAVFAKNSKRTGFEYEETQYLKYAAKDVNNYIAVKKDGGCKRKGLYAIAGVQEMKNPTMEVCSNAAAAYLETGVKPEDFIKKAKDIRDFVAVRNVRGGGVQHTHYIEVDDWEEIRPGEWIHPHMSTQPVKRKSRPKQRIVGIGGKPFGRVARWYMTTETLPAITSMIDEVAGVRNGGQVAKTEGGKLLMTLTGSMPKDLDRKWYIDETYRILNDLGLKIA